MLGYSGALVLTYAKQRAHAPTDGVSPPHLRVINTMMAIQGCSLSAMYTEAAAMSKIAGPMEKTTVESMVWMELVPGGVDKHATGLKSTQQG
jgi:hypothetical protein